MMTVPQYTAAVFVGSLVVSVGVVLGLWFGMKSVQQSKRLRKRSASMRETFLLNALMVAITLSLSTIAKRWVETTNMHWSAATFLDANVAIVTTFGASFFVYVVSGGENPD